MTCARERGSVARKWGKLSLRRALICYMCVFMIILFMKNASAAATWVSSGVSLCVRTLIPSLFPFMVISSMVISSGACTELFGAIARPLCPLLGVSRDGACALVLGWLCGFPIGAKCACELYREGRIGFDEYDRLTCVSGTPSPAFLILSVGKGMLGDVRLGVTLYALSVSCAIISGAILNARRTKSAKAFAPPLQRTRQPLPQAFVHAVSDSAMGMLNVCAFVVFFSALLGVIEQSIKFLALSDVAHALIFSLFEMTGGLYRISELCSQSALPLCALAAGWSGLCVHFQTVAICGGSSLRLPRYLFVQLWRAVLGFCICAVAQWIIK